MLCSFKPKPDFLVLASWDMLNLHRLGDLMSVCGLFYSLHPLSIRQFHTLLLYRFGNVTSITLWVETQAVLILFQFPLAPVSCWLTLSWWKSTLRHQRNTLFGQIISQKLFYGSVFSNCTLKGICTASWNFGTVLDPCFHLFQFHPSSTDLHLSVKPSQNLQDQRPWKFAPRAQISCAI